MKLTKTQWLVAAAIAGVAIWYFFLRKKDEKKESGYYMYNPNEDSLNSSYFDMYGSDGTESGYSIFEPLTESNYAVPPSASKYNQGQLCKKDKQCGGNLKCIKGRCTPPVIPPRPIMPRPLFPTSPTTTTTTTTPLSPRGTFAETLGGTGTGVVSPTTSTSTPTLSGATGMSVEAGYMM